MVCGSILELKCDYVVVQLVLQRYAAYADIKKMIESFGDKVNKRFSKNMGE